MKLLPQIAEKIYEKYKERDDAEEPRKHLGASQIGQDCLRAVQLSYRFAKDPEFDGRLLRLFEAGNAFEPRIVAELKSIGFDVKGEQTGFGDDYLGGSCDGLIKFGDNWWIIEMKTHSEKSFKDLEKNGVQKSKYQHYCQMQVYMGFSKLKNALYIAENKNTSHLYFEQIEFDEVCFNEMKRRAVSVIDDNALLPAIAGASETFFKCKWCDHYSFCHQEAVVNVNCRTCMKWSKDTCGGHKIPDKVLFNGCKNHIYHPMFSLKREPLKGDNDWIIYGDGICNVTGAGFPTIDDGDLVGTFTSMEMKEVGSWDKLVKVALVKGTFEGE